MDRRILLPCTALLLAAGAAALLGYRSDGPPTADTPPTKATAPAEKISSIRRPEEKRQHQPPAEMKTAPAQSDSTPAPVTQMDFDLDAIAAALSQLALDDRGRLQLDDNALTSLNAAFLRPRDPMSEEQFADLQTLILAGLPDDTGRQAAAVAQRFYHYSNAYRDIAGSLEVLATPEDMQRGFQRLSRLRRDHLGEELAQALFGKEERLMQYTLESMRIQSDQTLSTEEKAGLQQQLSESLAARADASSPEQDSSATTPPAPAGKENR